MYQKSDVVLLRIYIGESDQFDGKPLYKYLLEYLRELGIAGATAFRGLAGFGKNSVIHTTSILRLSSDMPIMIEIVEGRDIIENIKPKLREILNGGLITEEKVKVVYYEGNNSH